MNIKLTDWKSELKKLIDTESCIKESDILFRIPASKHSLWDNHMRGKTCPLFDNGDHGVYSWDLQQFLGKVTPFEE
jgi:hypothetical protein